MKKHVAVGFTLAMCAAVFARGRAEKAVPVGGSTAATEVGVIYDNVAAGGGIAANGEAPASQLESTLLFEAGAADDFVLPSSPLCTWNVTGVRWTGTYWNGDAPGTIGSVRVIFWPDTGEGPA